MSEELKAVVAEMRNEASRVISEARQRRYNSWATRIEAATAPISGLSGEEREAYDSCAFINTGTYNRGVPTCATAHYVNDKVRTLLATVRRLATAPADSLGVDTPWKMACEEVFAIPLSQIKGDLFEMVRKRADEIRAALQERQP